MTRLVCLLALCLSFAAPGFGADLVVTTTADGADPIPDDGDCDDGAGNCTVRAAFQTSNALPGSDEVFLSAGVFTLTLKRDTSLPDAATGDLDVTDDVVVFGGGSGVPCDGTNCSRIDGSGAKDRVFDVAEGTTLELVDVSVAGGKAAKGDFNPGQFEEVSGGCIRSAGDLDFERVVIESCSSPDDGGCIGAFNFGVTNAFETLIRSCKAKDSGGGIEVDESALHLDRVTISGSKAAEGGAIETSGGSLDLENFTASGNKARLGGGVFAESAALVELNNTSFVNNKASEGAALSNGGDGTTIELSNSLLRTAGKENNCAGVITSEGGNLENGTGCGFTFGGGDCPDCDPDIVEELADNGGPVPTHALGPNSEAIDLGVNMTCEAADARGAPREGDCDAGAFEFGGVVP